MIDKAIKAAQRPAETAQRAKFDVTLSTGRRVTFDVPADCTDAELLELHLNVWAVRANLAAHKVPALTIARAPLPPAKG